MLSKVTCPKCGSASGDDWSQCGGRCPMPESPHYVPEDDVDPGDVGVGAGGHGRPAGALGDAVRALLATEAEVDDAGAVVRRVDEAFAEVERRLAGGDSLSPDDLRRGCEVLAERSASRARLSRAREALRGALGSLQAAARAAAAPDPRISHLRREIDADRAVLDEARHVVEVAVEGLAPVSGLRSALVNHEVRVAAIPPDDRSDEVRGAT